MDKENNAFLEDDFEDMTADESMDHLEDHLEDEFGEDLDEMSDPWERENARLQEKESSRSFSGVWD